MADTSSDKQLLNQKLIVEKIGAGNKMKIADFGCGSSGFFVFPLAQMVGKEGTVYAIDVKKAALDNIARTAKVNNLKQVKTIWSNLEMFNATFVESESVDVGLLINVLNQSNKRVEMIKEVMRMLKHHGKLLIIDWNNVSFALGPISEHKVNVELLKSGLRRLGMKLEEEFVAGEYHYGLIFTKI